MPQKRKRLLVIDANSLIHRAWHALPELTDSKGRLVNALYGFLVAFLKAVKEFDPDYVAAAFDVKGPTNREKLYKEYKAKRVKAPEELYAQIPLIKEALGAFHAPVFEKEGYEADDVIGSLVKQARRKHAHPPLDIIVLSGDLDALQLVGDSVRVSTMRKGLRDVVLYDERAVKERFGGLTPSQLPDYKGLRGDPSDNLPGVKGIGEKTAIDLLNRFGSLERLYEEMEQDRAELPEKTKKLLEEHKEDAFSSKGLGTIDQQLPLEFSLEELAFKGSDPAEARQFLERFQFSSLIPRIPGSILSSVKDGSTLSSVKDVVLNRTKGTKGTKDAKDARDTEARIARLQEEGVLSPQIAELERALVPVLGSMEDAGIMVDKPHFRKLERELARELRSLEKDIFKKAGTEFNISSPPQLSQVLFGELGLSSKGLKKTPGGVISTASGELDKLREAHPVVAALLRYRELAKLQNTYVVPLPKMADKKGRVHTTFDQLGAATGRLSSSAPNLQNIPVQGEWGRKIRRGFVAEKGRTFLALDYSQMELRVVAHLADDPVMQEAFSKREDIHRRTAAEVFGVPAAKVTTEQRFRAKALNFGIIYGMGARGFSQSSGVSAEDAQDFIDRYFARFPGVRAYLERSREEAAENGYAETLWGRKRFLPDIHSATPYLRAAAERAAVNHPVQGGSADIMKKAMVDIGEELRGAEKEIRMLLQIHDELLFEVKPAKIPAYLPRLAALMEHACELKAPLAVQAKKGPSWGELRPLARHN